MRFENLVSIKSSGVNAPDDVYMPQAKFVILTLFFLLSIVWSELATATQNHYPLIQSTDDGQIVLSIDTQTSSIPFNELHKWIVTVKDRSGKAIQAQAIVIDGNMPRHSHGLPTQPQLSQKLGNGQHLIEGLKFHMPGVWQIRFKCLVDNVWHYINFKLLIGPDITKPENTLSQSEISVLKSLWLTPDRTLPNDPTNNVANNIAAAKLGQQIFFDPNFSRNKQISCSICHLPEKYFTDGRIKSKGLTEVNRNAPGLIGVAYNEWFYWDGRRDSLWAQALTPFEATQEMGLTRVEVLQIIANNLNYSNAYNKLFGHLPEWIIENKVTITPASPIGNDVEKSAWKKIPPRDKRAINMAFANVGKTIAAYERNLLPAPALFDRYMNALVNKRNHEAQKILSPQQQAGMKLFISGKSQCLTCHNGPLLSNQSFHNIGTGLSKENSQVKDMGRFLGIQAVLLDQFNCQGLYSDATPKSCGKLKYINRQEIGALMNGAFKVPSLRNLAYTAPYMHDGRFDTLLDVLKHYQNPPDKTQSLHEISKLDLSDQDLENIAVFLKTLSAPMNIPPKWLNPSIHK